MHTDGRLPVTVFTGPLGAGKTTLINHLISLQSYKCMAVIENQVGDICVVDHPNIITQSAVECVCTLESSYGRLQVRRDIARVLHHLLQRGGCELDAVFIETSATADPAAIVHTLHLDPILRKAVRLDAVIAVMDCSTGIDALQPQKTSVGGAQMTARQLALADCIILNKADKVTAEQIAALRQHLGSFSPDVRVLPCVQSSVMFDEVCNLRSYDMDKIAAQLLKHSSKGSESADHRTSVNSQQPVGCQMGLQHIDLQVPGELGSLSLHMWLTQLLQRHGDCILWIRSVLAVAGSNHKHVFHGSHLMVQLGVASQPWQCDEARRSRIVIKAFGLDVQEILKGLNACKENSSIHSMKPPSIQAAVAVDATSWVVEQTTPNSLSIAGY